MKSELVTALLGHEDEEESLAFLEYLRSVVDPDSPYYVPYDRIQLSDKDQEIQSNEL